MLGGLGGGKRTPFKVAAGSFASPGEDSGHCCIALRPIKRGECVLFEAPCVMTRGVSAEVSDGPSAMQADEWQLTYELLVAGKGIPWADSYVRTPRAPEVESAAAVSWLQEATGATAETVLAVFRTVANNAFANNGGKSSGTARGVGVSIFPQIGRRPLRLGWLAFRLRHFGPRPETENLPPEGSRLTRFL